MCAILLLTFPVIPYPSQSGHLTDTGQSLSLIVTVTFEERDKMGSQSLNVTRILTTKRITMTHFGFSGKFCVN